MRMVRPCALASPARAQKTRPTSTSARRILKRDLRQLAITRLGLEELELFVPHWPGVPFHSRDEIGNEIGAAFQLDVDVRPRVLGADAEGDESIVETNKRKNDDDKDDQ